jgi:hypothetical protein
MKVSDLSAQDVVHLILFDNTGNMYASDEKVQQFIRQYCKDGLCPDTEIVDDYVGEKSAEMSLTIKRLGIENTDLHKRIDELKKQDDGKIALRYKLIQKWVEDCMNIIEKYSHGTADPARTLWQVSNKIQRMYYPEEANTIEN